MASPPPPSSSSAVQELGAFLHHHDSVVPAAEAAAFIDYLARVLDLREARVVTAHRSIEHVKCYTNVVFYDTEPHDAGPFAHVAHVSSSPHPPLWATYEKAVYPVMFRPIVMHRGNDPFHLDAQIALAQDAVQLLVAVRQRHGDRAIVTLFREREQRAPGTEWRIPLLGVPLMRVTVQGANTATLTMMPFGGGSEHTYTLRSEGRTTAPQLFSTLPEALNAFIGLV